MSQITIDEELLNQVAAISFEVIQAHEKVLELQAHEALTVLERLTHATKKNPHPVMPLANIVEDAPALFRRAAIHAALGSARPFFTHLSRTIDWFQEAWILPAPLWCAEAGVGFCILLSKKAFRPPKRSPHKSRPTTRPACAPQLT